MGCCPQDLHLHLQALSTQLEQWRPAAGFLHGCRRCLTARLHLVLLRLCWLHLAWLHMLLLLLLQVLRSKLW